MRPAALAVIVAVLVFATLVGGDLLLIGIAPHPCVPNRGCRGSAVPYLLGGGLLFAAAIAGWVWLRRTLKRHGGPRS